MNALIGEERVIAFDLPGTTRDSIEVPFERDGKHYTLIDTAGIRRRGKVFEAIEKFSVVKTLQSISDANVVILLLDARQDIADQDAHIAGFILESGRALVVAVNKWDGLPSGKRDEIRSELERKLHFLTFANFILFLRSGKPASAADEIRERRLCGSYHQVADAEVDACAGNGGGAPAAATQRAGASEIALCAPGWTKSADYCHSRQCLECNQRLIQTLSGKTL